MTLPPTSPPRHNCARAVQNRNGSVAMWHHSTNRLESYRCGTAAQLMRAVNKGHVFKIAHGFNNEHKASNCFQSGPYSPSGGVEEMQGGGRRVRLEWGAYITV
ncbi:hypothetical protein FHG87_012677 [Trinorchestia longiramus]|nr:hypothetical protein FHG87_012677 [Trinorchestia longiramus]